MPLKTHRDELPSLNLTPMIDIVFLLIIFFMVSTSFSQMERDIRLQVPRVKSTGPLTPAPEKKVINVYRDGRITLDGQPVTLEELQRRLRHARKLYPDQGVVIRGDGQGTFQRVAEVLDSCRQAGLKELAVSVQPIRIRK